MRTYPQFHLLLLFLRLESIVLFLQSENIQTHTCLELIDEWFHNWLFLFCFLIVTIISRQLLTETKLVTPTKQLLSENCMLCDPGCVPQKLFCISVLGRLRDLPYIFAVTSGSPSKIIQMLPITLLCYEYHEI